MAFDLDEYVNNSGNNQPTVKPNKKFDLDEYVGNTNNAPINNQPIIKQPLLEQPKPEPIQQPVQPVYAKNGVVEGNTSYNQNWDKHGNVYYTDENGNRIDDNVSLGRRITNGIGNAFRSIGNKRMLPADVAHPNATAFIHGVGNTVVAIPQIANTIMQKITGKQNNANVAIRDNWNRAMGYDKPRTTSQKVFNLLGEMAPLLPLGFKGAELSASKILPQVAKSSKGAQFIASHPKIASTLASIPGVTLENTGWGAGDYGARKLQGLEDEASLGESIRNAVILGNSIHLGAPVAGNLLSKGYDKVADKVAQSEFGAKTLGTIHNLLNAKSNNAKVTNYQNLDNLLAQGNSQPFNQMSREQLVALLDSKNITAEESQQIKNILQHGIETDKVSPEMQEMIFNTNKNIAKDVKNQTAPNWVDTLPKYDSVEQATLDGKAKKWNTDELSHLSKEEVENINKTTHKEQTPLSEEKVSEGINTPKEVETPQNEPSIPTQNENIKSEQSVIDKNVNSTAFDAVKLQKEKYQRQRDRMNGKVVETNTTNSGETTRKIGKDGRVTVYNPDGTIKVKFKRTTTKEAPSKPYSTENMAEGVEEANSKLYELRTKPEKGTNGLTEDNAIEVSDNSNAKLNKRTVEELDKDLLPEDVESLKKEIDEWNEKDFKQRQQITENKIESRPQDLGQINGITKRYFNRTGLDKFPNDLKPKSEGKMVKVEDKLSNGDTRIKTSYIAKYNGLANTLRTPSKVNDCKRAIDALCNLPESQEAGNVLEHLYKQSTGELRNYIEQRVQSKGLKYKFDGSIDVKSKRQLAKENKQVRTYMEDEPTFTGNVEPQGFTPTMQSATTKVSDSAKVKPYKGNNPASNKGEFRDPVTNKEVKIDKSSVSNEFKARISDINNNIKANSGLMDFDGFGNVNKTYTNKRITIKLKDAIKGDAELEKAFNKIGDIDVHFEDVLTTQGKQGFYDHKTNSITIYSNCENIGKTLAHEARHAVQNQLKKQTWIGSRWRKLHKSCIKRNKEVLDYVNKNSEVIEYVTPLYNQLNSGTITEGEFISKVSLNDANIYREYLKLYKKYKNSYLEKDARNFAGGNYGKRLFHKGEATIRGELRKTKSTYNRFNKKRYGFNDFGELFKSSNESEQRFAKRRDGSEFGVDGKNHENVRKSPTIDVAGKSKIPNWKESNARFLKDLSVDNENIAKDLGLITEDQAVNRIKQQTKSKNGYYFKEGNEYYKGNGLDVTKDYNAKRDSKVGLFGKKTKEDLDKVVTAESRTRANIEENIRRHHTQDVVDLVEKDFAQSIPENGKAPKNYTIVNKQLLANAIYGKYTKAWYETLSNGKEAIEKAFKNKEQADAWLDLHNRTSKGDFMIPNEVFNKLFNGSGETVSEYWSRYGKTHTPQALGRTAGLILDVINERWKRGVLTSGSFFVNNRIGNQLMLMAHSDNPVQYAKSIVESFTIKDKDIPVELADSSILEGMNEFANRRVYSGNQSLDNALNLFNGNLIDITKLDGAKFVGGNVANLCFGIPNKAFNKISDAVMKFNSTFEELERKQALSIELSKAKKELIQKTGQQILTTKEAIQYIDKNPEMSSTIVSRIEDVLGDYSKFTNAEKKVIKRIVPFYAWYRTISRHTSKLIQKHPSRFAMIMLELDRLKENDKDLKEYQKGSIRTGIKDKRSGKELLINKQANAIPWNTGKEFAGDMLDNSEGNIARRLEKTVLNPTSPAIKTTVEALEGKHLFRDGEITSKRYMKIKDFRGGEYYLDKETGKKLDNLPASVRSKYVAKELGLKTAYPILNSRLANPQGLIQASQHNGLEPDKLYDADLGGYYHKEKFKGKHKRYATNNLSEEAKIANRFGASLQNKQSLNKDEKKDLKKRTKEYKEKHKNKKKNK